MNNKIEETWNTDQEMAKIDLIRLYHAVVDKAWIIVLSALAGAVLLFGHAKWFVAPQYVAQSMIYVLGSSTSITSMADIQIGSILTVDFETIARSRPVVEELIEELDLHTDYQSMVSMLSIEKLSDTRILRFTVRYSDPEAAKDLANEWATITATRIENIMKTDRPSVLEWAVAPSRPVSPDLKGSAVKGAFMGGVLAAAIIAFRFLMNDRIHREDEIERYLGLSVLAVLPMENGKKVSR